MKFKLNTFERVMFSTVLQNMIDQLDLKIQQDPNADHQPVQIFSPLKKQMIAFAERYATVGFSTNEEQLEQMKKDVENETKVVFSNKALLLMFQEEVDNCR